MTRAKWLPPFLVLLACIGIGAGSAAAATEARTSPAEAAKFVQDLGNRAVALLANYDESETTKHQAAFKELVRKGFDLDLIGRFVLGASWRTATPEQRQEYQQLFATWVLNSYARRLGAYKGERFKVTGSQPIAETDALILTTIERPDGAPINAGWRVREIKGQMKIIDVVVEGVSMALTQRQEFASVIQRRGLSGLIHDLRERVNNLQAPGQS
jgi:phospholipid transport system substrate-binding protein